MSFHFFTIPTLDPEAAQDALNQFCIEHRVVAVDRQFVAAWRDSHWAVCVTGESVGALSCLPNSRHEQASRAAEPARPMDQTGIPGRAGFERHGELQGARGAGRDAGRARCPKAPRVADFSWPDDA